VSKRRYKIVVAVKKRINTFKVICAVIHQICTMTGLVLALVALRAVLS
jgi:ubiquinone biosynthesis protein COQ9